MRKVLIWGALMAIVLVTAIIWYGTAGWFERRALRKQAVASCLCERRAGSNGKQACWSAFEKAIAPKHAKSTAGNKTFCGFVSPGYRFWKEGDADYEVITHYRAAGPNGKIVTLCTRAEADKVEEAMEKDLDGPAGRVSAATLKMAEDISLGRPIGGSSPWSSCL